MEAFRSVKDFYGMALGGRRSGVCGLIESLELKYGASLAKTIKL
jgi:hypothetical protein